MFLRGSLAVLALAAFVVPAAAQSNQTYFGPQVGVFYPTDSKLKKALGDQWISFGLGRVQGSQYQQRKNQWDTNFTSQSKNGNKVFMAAGSYGVFMPLSGTDRGFGIQETGFGFTPYVALRGGLSYIDFAATINNKRESGKRIGFNANAEVGVLLNKNLTVSARYDIFSSHNGLTFNGVSLSLQYGFLKF